MKAASALTTTLNRVLDALLPETLLRRSFDQESLRRAAAVALIASVMIIVTGSVVRVTGSGLGCETWPLCSEDSLVATAAHGLHGAIEFGNRLLTLVVCGASSWLIVVAARQRAPQPSVEFWAWMQLGVIVLNAMLGGITVWLALNPFMVATHFLAATLLLASTTAAWHRACEQRSAPGNPATPRADATTTFLAAGAFMATTALFIAGTAVTGSGPHTGDDSDIPRMGFDWLTAAAVHGLIAVIVGLFGVALWQRTRHSGSRVAHRRVTHFLIVLCTQGILGLVQIVTGLLEVLIVLHIFGAALAWVGAVRILLDAFPAAGKTSGRGAAVGRLTMS